MSSSGTLRQILNIKINFSLEVHFKAKQSELFQLFATRVNGIGGIFIAGVLDTGGNFPPVLSPRIFEKFSIVIFRGLGEDDS
jgi:hypothetical protein